jgi:ATP-binding cassette subfamily F protein uup
MILGLVGPNGSGKSTLLKLIQNTLPPDSGTVEHADQLRIVYYDQHREDLPEDRTLRRALAEDSDTVHVQGRYIHVSSYAKNFGFRTEQLDTFVSKLSGGERARLLLARMLQKPADVLILDEPTNDLDIDTLEVLEESLLSFPGAVILVTHDRYLMDRVSTGILGLDGYGDHGFFADYSQYAMDQRGRELLRDSQGTAPTITGQDTQSSTGQTKRTPNKKLSYKEQREWDAMESNIMEAEKALSLAQTNAQHPTISANSVKLQEAFRTVETAQASVDRLYARWAELESKLKD